MVCTAAALQKTANGLNIAGIADTTAQVSYSSSNVPCAYGPASALQARGNVCSYRPAVDQDAAVMVMPPHFACCPHIESANPVALVLRKWQDSSRPVAFY